MAKLKALYIEDEQKNIDLYTVFFADYDIEIVSLDKFPQDPKEIFSLVVSNDIDFLIIDYELDKASVSYEGIDVLNAIRSQDNTIYAILLTNYPLTDDKFSGGFGEYDYQLEKRDLDDKMNEIAKKAKRACLRKRENDTLADMELLNDRLMAYWKGVNEVKK